MHEIYFPKMKKKHDFLNFRLFWVNFLIVNNADENEFFTFHHSDSLIPFVSLTHFDCKSSKNWVSYKKLITRIKYIF